MKGFKTIEHIWGGTGTVCDRCSAKDKIIQIGVVEESHSHGVQLCEKCLQSLRDRLIKSGM